MNSLALVSEREIVRKIKAPDWVFDTLEDDTQQRRFWVTKGLGAGGTYGGCIWHYMMCLINRNSPYSWAVAPTYQQIADTLIPTFSEVFQRVFGMEESIDYEIVRSSTPRIEFLKRRQAIHFKSANRPERLVGANISHALLTEPGLYAREAYTKVSGRIRCPKAERKQLMGEGTPEGIGNFYEQEANFDPGIDEANNRARIVLWTEDNPVLTQEYIDMLRRAHSYDPQKLESYLFGRFVTFNKGNAYWEFAHSRNIKIGQEASPLLPIAMTWDWNHTPLAWCALQKQPVWNRSGGKFDRYTVLGESTGKYKGIMDACAEFIVQFDPLKFKDTPIEIDGDPVGWHPSYLTAGCAFDQVVDALRKYYNNVTVYADRKAPRIQHRLQKHNALLSYGYLIISPWCRNTIKSHEQTNLKPGTWEIEKGKDDLVTHWGDALGYYLYRMTKHIDLDKPNTKQIYGTN